MPQKKMSVEADARTRAAQLLGDGKPILDKALLIRCAERIDGLTTALQEIIDQSQSRGSIWARQRAERALEADE